MSCQEAAEIDLRRLRWTCRRGMKELDLLLTRYLDQYFSAASPSEQQGFRELLELQDPLLHAYCVGRVAPPSAEVAALLDRITGLHA